MTDIVDVVLGISAALIAVLLFCLLASALFVGFLAALVLLKRQWVPVTYSIRSLARRKVTTLVTVAGLSLVVFVFTTALMLASGIEQTLVATGAPLNAKVLRKGAASEIDSTILAEQARILASSQAVAAGDEGRSLVSPEVVVVIFAAHQSPRSDADGTNLTVRGMAPIGFELHQPESLEGKMFQEGTSQIVIGKALVGRFEGATLGGKMKFGRRAWTVVGVADHGGTAFDSEIWGDAKQMEAAFNRRPATVTLRLKNASDIETLAAAMASDPRQSSLEIVPEIDYWEARSRRFARFVGLLGGSVALIFAGGAILGAMITMYAQVSSRTREIGTLRAIGFKQRAVLVSLVTESVLLALLAAGVALGAAALAQRFRFSTMNWQTHSEVTFAFELTPTIVLASLAFAAVIGHAGGLLPAWRAARVPLVTAFRGG
jgi:ABC-type lipoprotein release transport system permease subunit